MSKSYTTTTTTTTTTIISHRLNNYQICGKLKERDIVL
jgi:hypothetical protein